MQSKKPPIHPGVYIKQSIIPKKLSVKKAAEMLGIGRPALSNLLNGNAALSPDMAMRVEKAFHVDASTLLEIQTRYDESEARIREDDIAVRAYVPKFLEITAHEIDSWADADKARRELPAILRTLVHSTGNNLTRVDFPAFDNSQRRGWDGQVTSESATPWIPRGQSGWEFGCSQNPKSKADSDYRNRTDRVSKIERNAMTFVFVTPRNWVGKDDWAKDKCARCEWKDVRAFDASDLEQWLEQSIPAQTRIREFLGGAGQEVKTLDHIWLEWAGVTQPELPKELFQPAAERYQEQIHDWLKEPPVRPFVVAADSSIEALAFLSCSLEQLAETCSGCYERAIVIRSLEVFRTISRISSNYIAIVASSEVEQALAGLHKKTHTIIVRGRNTLRDDPDIALDPLGHEPFSKALRETGLDDTRISQLARESARSPTILRRRLAEVEAVKIPPWAKDSNVARKLIPLMFAGAWDAGIEADKEILSCLTDRHSKDVERIYKDIERTIAELLGRDEPPIWSISNHRGVVSKIDVLFAVHGALTRDDLKNFLFAAEVVLSEQDPALELPEDRRWAATLYEKSRDHSSALRQGLCDTLVLLAVHGNALVSKRLGIDLERAVGGVVRSLLPPSPGSTWLSQKEDLPQYAEAAPVPFLDIVEADLNSENPQLAVLFVPAGVGPFGGCPRTGMLWALELLAWKPERLFRITSILAKLCEWRVDDNWANKPMNTLQSIFRCGMPQTGASLEKRNQALEKLTRKFPDVGWQVCMGQFNSGFFLGINSHKPRWRTDAFDAGKVTTDAEAWEGRCKAVELALDWPGHDEHTLGDLIECVGVLNPDQRSRVWELISAWNDTGPNDGQKAELRERIRNWVLTRRGWHEGLDADDRSCARKAYELLAPRNPVARHQWLFANQWVEETADELEDEELDIQKREERITRQRLDALQEVWAESGLGGTKELCRSGDAFSIGLHIGEIHAGVEQRVKFVQEMLAEESTDLQGKCEGCVSGFLIRLDSSDRDTVLQRLLTYPGFDEGGIVRLLGCAPFDAGTWQHVDQLATPLKQRYWETVNPRWDPQDASAIATVVDEFLKVNRPHAAFHVVRMDWGLLDSPRLMHLLMEVATNESEPSDQYRIDHHHVSKALDSLEQRGDTSRDDLARLEFCFIRILNNTKHGIPNLEAQLSESPVLFMQALALVFKRKDGGEDPVEWQLPSADNRKLVAEAAYSLLTNASRIPGTQSDASINPGELKGWLEQVRTLAVEYGRVDIGDQMVGQLLSHCPSGEDGIWPCEPVREVIDDIGSQEIANGMSIGIQNAQGPFWRGEDEPQERVLAEKYRNWSRELAIEFPFTANMLEQIAASYDDQATWWESREGVRQRLEY